MATRKRTPEKVISGALARLAAREAVRCDAHVIAWQRQALVESLVRQWGDEHDPAKRRVASRSLVGMAAHFMRSGDGMPDVMRMWLAERLQDALIGSADRAFGLKPGSGTAASVHRHMHNAALVHALMTWRGLSQSAAAVIGAEFGVKQRQKAGDVGASTSELVKHHNVVQLNWQIVGPVTAADEITGPATESDLRAGLSVAVVFESKAARVDRVFILLPAGLADAEP